ncbi:diguanylate cyclase (GGDEF) domain-containing protein [Marinobacter sp. es.048]|uniref:sensor domain-containing diguanylate cyclase n=1 Tax=Marinobacter sp. es.048 TaxID=1761795 RepID=UPI000B587B28|nr:diguanylate cyclase [Marinobacter sp. es.048]SNC60476.1 diguanylate cyclase (GGDEF) domain-containing protein [Marinobacter sp. es.048]
MATGSSNGQQSDMSARFFQKLASGVPGVLFTYWLSADKESHRYPFVSDQVQTLFGLDPAALNENADAVFSLIHPDDADVIIESIAESALKLTPWRYRGRLRLRNGEYEWFEVQSEPERQSDGSTIWYGQFHNIQHYKNLEQSLRESEAEFSFQAGFQRLIARLSTEFINLGFGTIDQCIDELLRSIGVFFKVDRAYLYSFSDDYAVMTNTHEWCKDGVPTLIDTQEQVSIEDFHWWQEQIEGMVSGSRVVFIEDVDRLPHEAAAERALLQAQGVHSMFSVPIRVRGRVTGFFGVDSLQRRTWRMDQADLLIIVSGLLSGVLERHRLEEELLNQSIRDPLTGLHNRRYLMPRLYEMLGLSNRRGERFALAIFDIDHFKKINDSIGHLGGDYVLQRFADILVSQTRSMDVVARFGGEEFIVVFSAVEHDDVRQLVQRVLQAVHEESFVFDDEEILVTVSAGVAGIDEFVDRPATPDALIEGADCRLYLAKQAGRDCFVDVSGTSRI